MIGFQCRKATWVFFSVCVTMVLASPAQTFNTLLNFTGNDGAQPDFAALIQGSDGGLYGTTLVGGDSNLGTVFKTTPGAFRKLYSFTNNDGTNPKCSLVLATDGNFYGTTYAGGTNSVGTVFRITPAGALTTLHSFDASDGSYPSSTLLQASDGNLYGATGSGGTMRKCNAGCGTLFRISLSGALTTIHKFNSSDGANPTGGLLEGADGELYGTTENGGASNAGTIFKIGVNGGLVTLHSFSGTDGSNVFAGLVQGADGNFYGTTVGGGTSDNGTVFRISPEGAFVTLANLSYGSEPNAGLIQATDGNFYGATTFGGGFVCGNDGCGTVFQMTPTGTLTTLHSFDGTDGNFPTSSLFQATSGTLYGSTTVGGTDNQGTVFSLNMGLGPFVAFVRNPSKVGQQFGILGQGLTGTTSVSLNGSPAPFTVRSGTLIIATVPAGATTGYVTVTSPSGVLKSNVPFYVIQ